MTNLSKRESVIDCIYSYFNGGTCYQGYKWYGSVELSSKCVRGCMLDASGFREEKKSQSTKWSFPFL
jgi:hypothetical protein